MPDRIYHLALRREWLRAQHADRTYRRSTLETSLEDEGFIHCSFAHQVQGVADRYYRGQRDVVLLIIDPSAVLAEVRVENQFPHIYGPLPVDAVLEVKDVPIDADGRLTVDTRLDDG